MLTGIARGSAIAALTTAAVALAGYSTAHADSQGPGTDCPTGSTTCTVKVIVPGSPGGTATTGPSGGGSGASDGGSSTGSGGATSTPTPEPTMVNGSCTYTPDPTYQPLPGADQHTGQQGAWYLMTCPDAVKPGNPPIATTVTSEVWLATPPAAPALPAPAVLAAQAKQLLKLTTPVIASNPRPGLPQLVGVGLWAWIPQNTFQSVSATASVPGESVTATATPVSTTWSFGDGSSVTCAGAGTPFPTGGDPAASSPDCGHTYSHSSGSGAYTVTATINWNVTWAGAGQTGAFNGMTTTVSEQVVVQQSQALVTNG